MIKLIIADDHKIVVQLLKSTIQSQPDMEVVGVAFDGQQVVKQVKELDAQLVLLDVSMPRLNGIEAIPRILKAKSETNILCLTSNQRVDIAFKVIQAGARGYITKNCETDELLKAIRETAKGNRYLSAEILQAVSEDAASMTTCGFGRLLTEKEKEVLQLIAEGNALKLIASKMNISIKTVEKHRASISKKTGIKSIAGLTKYAIQEGFSDLMS